MSSETFNRWYDQNPKTSTAINTMFKFPDEILVIICNGIVILVERDLEHTENLKSYKTLGTDKILALYKSKQRKRVYDQHPIVHKMVNYLYQLSPENRQFMADHIISIMKLVQEYLQACADSNQSPEVTDVEELTSTYVNKGSDDAERLLESIAKEFMQGVRTSRKPSGETVKESNKDLRLSDR